MILASFGSLAGRRAGQDGQHGGVQAFASKEARLPVVFGTDAPGEIEKIRGGPQRAEHGRSE